MASNDPYDEMTKSFRDVEWEKGQTVRVVGKSQLLAAPYASGTIPPVTVPRELVVGLEGLTFAALRSANEYRCPMFKNAKGETQHSGRDWDAVDWLVALVGELGEAANLLKKLRRGDFTTDEVRPKVARELADVVIYFDMLVNFFGLNLGDDVILAKTFDDIRKVNRELRQHADWGDEPNVYMNNAVVCIGGIAAVIAETYQLGISVPRDPIIGQTFATFFIWIEALSDILGVDLGDVVTETFNKKSQELGLPVFLVGDDWCPKPG